MLEIILDTLQTNTTFFFLLSSCALIAEIAVTSFSFSPCARLLLAENHLYFFLHAHNC
jgi:hypothetical protein